MSPAGSQMPEPAGEKQPSVLVVEDDVLLRVSAADILRDADFVVVEAVNGDEAKAVLEAGVAIDVIFSDINMDGGIDGVALAHWAAEHHPDTCVVLTSGLQNGLNIAQATCPRVKAFLLKPYDYDALITRLRALIALRAKHT